MYCFNTDQQFDYELMEQFKDSLGNPPQKFCPCCLLMEYSEHFEDTHGFTSTTPISEERIVFYTN